MKNKFDLGQRVYYLTITENKLKIYDSLITRIFLKDMGKPNGDIIYMVGHLILDEFEEVELFSTFAEAKSTALKQINELTEN
ncbi:MAG: hypothetical protein WC495_06270 [Patescibacteria group bacterium]|jgi:hypothetical protein